jgi:hypothetical protein
VKRLSVFVLAVLVLAIFAGCGKSQDSAQTSQTDSSGGTITFMGTSANFNGTTVDGGTVRITSGGTYVLCGTLTDGQVIIDAPAQQVELVLQDVAMNSSAGSAIDVLACDSVAITVHDSTKNTVSSDCPDSGDATAPAINATCAVTIDGGGSLSVTSEYGSGIYTSQDISSEAVNLTVEAAVNGIHGSGGVYIQDGKYTITAQGDGIKAGDGDSIGNMEISGGTFKISSGDDGFAAKGDITVSNGEFDIVSAGGSGVSGTHSAETASGDASDARGFNADGALTVSGGTLKIDAADDAVNAGSVTIDAGSLELYAGGKGIHSDGTLTVNSGEISIDALSEGIEGASVEINEGSVDVVSGEDGINANGGDGNIEPRITVNGGIVTINALGDGFDSNGGIYINDGYITVSGADSGPDSAIDFAVEDGYELVINGGTVIACGTDTMAEKASSNSRQCSIMWLTGQQIQAGQTITVTDNQGSVLMQYTAEKNCTAVIVSCPELEIGHSYTLSDGENTAVAVLSSASVLAGDA